MAFRRESETAAATEPRPVLISATHKNTARLRAVETYNRARRAAACGFQGRVVAVVSLPRRCPYGYVHVPYYRSINRGHVMWSFVAIVTILSFAAAFILFAHAVLKLIKKWRDNCSG